MAVYFQSELTDFQLDKSAFKARFISEIVKKENRKLGSIKYIFVSEEKILEINKAFLKHYYLTDIITFNYSFLDSISGEIFICIAIVKENSKIHGTGNFLIELSRVIIHGVLHLVGYNDFLEEEKGIMREKEDFYMKYLGII